MVKNVHTGTENNAAHRLCSTVLHDMQIIDENCSMMAGLWINVIQFLGHKRK
jgi:hypothetical protein